MNIRLTHEYRGWKSKERLIPAGDYHESDERLFGIAQYLVATGLAVEIPDVEAPPAAWQTVSTSGDVVSHGSMSVVEDVYVSMSHAEAMEALGRDLPPTDDSDTTDDLLPVYADMTVDELRAECELRGIDLSQMEGNGANGRLLKDDLIAILEGDDLDEGA